MGGDANSVHVIDADGTESWNAMAKDAVARALVTRMADTLDKKDRP